MEKKNVAEIKKIVLKIDDKEINLSLEQAEKLKELLNTLLQKKEIKEEKVYIPYPQPYVPYRPYYWYWDSPILTCGGGTTQVSFDSSNHTVNCSL